MYNPKSDIATEFIDDEEIKATLAYADENKDNKELIRSIIEKAKDMKGLSHREASVLLVCQDPELLQEIFDLAIKIRKNSMETVSLCLLLFIWQTTVSTVVFTVHIIIRTSIFAERN
jgi:hypothetical protein